MTLRSEVTNQVLGKLDPVTYLSVYPHSCVPCHNLQCNILDEEINNTEFFSSFFNKVPYQVSCPIPVSFPTRIERKVINGFDPALNLVKNKKNWEDYKLQILKFCNKKMVENSTETSQAKTKVKVPLNVLLLANHIKKDPDPHFNANYNSYFNGSNVTCLDVGLDKFLIRPRSYENGEIVLSQLHINDNQWDIEYESLISSSTDIPGLIYEIEATNNIFFTRQKKCISLFNIENREQAYTVQKQLTIEKDCPIISMSSDGRNFCTLTAERELEVYDTMVVSSILKEKLDNSEDTISDSWGSVYYLNNNSLSYLDRSSYYLIDLRVKPDVIRKWSIKDRAEHCEEVYAGVAGNNELQYVVTSHQVLSLDLRIGFSQRWTHGITHSPAIISLLTKSSMDDTLFIGSQRNGSVILVENESIENKTYSKFHPYALPSLKETLHLSQYNGYCLSNTVSSRFNMSLTGLCCLENNGDITLFRTTSIGDVFKQTLIKCSEEADFQLNDSELNKLEDYGERCEDLQEQNNPCFVTDLLDDTNLLHCIQNNGKQYEETFDKTDSNNSEWCVSKKELYSYCDYLAPRILEEWGFDGVEEWSLVPEKNFDELSSDDEEDITERVTKWIEKYAGDMNVNDQQVVNEDDNLVSNVIEAQKNENTADIVNFDTIGKSEEAPTATPKTKYVSGF